MNNCTTNLDKWKEIRDEAMKEEDEVDTQEKSWIIPSNYNVQYVFVFRMCVMFYLSLILLKSEKSKICKNCKRFAAIER